MDASLLDRPAAEAMPLSLDHLFRITDGTGMIQHSLFSTPDPKYGYCIDDNARALKFVVRAHRIAGDSAVLPLVYTYLSFIRYAQTADGRFHNFMSFDRRWLDPVGSDDSFGRTIMGLGYALALAPEPGIGRAASDMLSCAREWVSRLSAPRAVAFAILGMARLAGTPAWDSGWEGILERQAAYLASLYRRNATPEWRWFEDQLTYSNARLSQALISASALTGDADLGGIGLDSLDFYLDQVFADDALDLVGHDGWFRRGQKKAPFDQQPVDAGAVVEACLTAAQASADRRYLVRARQALAWYTGRNRLGLGLIDPVTGGCADGLRPNGLNANQGAESLLSYLNARVAFQEFERGLP